VARTLQGSATLSDRDSPVVAPIYRLKVGGGGAICMRRDRRQPREHWAVACARDLSPPGVLAHDLCRKCPHKIGNNSVHTQWIWVARHARALPCPMVCLKLACTSCLVAVETHAGGRAPCAHHADLKTPPYPSDHGFYTYKTGPHIFIFFIVGPAPLA
jgi:hypothetical protein